MARRNCNCNQKHKVSNTKPVSQTGLFNWQKKKNDFTLPMKILTRETSWEVF